VGADRWPPCQAYSVAGRARNKGVNGYRPDRDQRQYLYAEYLHIIADRWPAVFVMENVKGLLSAKLRNLPLFDFIRDDLSAPAKALGRRSINGRAHRYTIYSLSPNGGLFDDAGLEDFVVQAERHGVPQARHRVILLGVRDDLVASSIPLRRLLPAVEEVPVRSVLDGTPPRQERTQVRTASLHGSSASRCT
jgi:DNA (cytosine-5)-methyltransferase 1